MIKPVRFAAGVMALTFSSLAYGFGGSPTTFSADIPSGWVIERKHAEELRDAMVKEASVISAEAEGFADRDNTITLNLVYLTLNLGGSNLRDYLKGVRSGLTSVANEVSYQEYATATTLEVRHRGMMSGEDEVDSRWLTTTETSGVSHMLIAVCVYDRKVAAELLSACRASIAGATLAVAESQRKPLAKAKKSSGIDLTLLIGGGVGVLFILFMWDRFRKRDE